jgi:hypothetical protein
MATNKPRMEAHLDYPRFMCRKIDIALNRSAVGERVSLPRPLSAAFVDRGPLHRILQVGEAGFAHPIVSRTELVIVTGCEALVLNIGAIEFGEFGPTCRAVIVVPIFTPAGVTAKLESESLQVNCVVDSPLNFGPRSNCHTLVSMLPGARLLSGQIGNMAQ